MEIRFIPVRKKQYKLLEILYSVLYWFPVANPTSVQAYL